MGNDLMKKMRNSESIKVGFCCTSFGFGPVSKAVSVAEAIHALRPDYRLVFIGSNVAEDYARKTDVFDDIESVDSDISPEVCAQYAQENQAVVNSLNFSVLEYWLPSMPPIFFLDSLAWMWPSIPPTVKRAKAYFIQDYLIDASSYDRTLPSNAELVPPILSPTICGPRNNSEVEEGYLLVNFAGCHNPVLPPRFYERYIQEMLIGLTRALVLLLDKKKLFLNRVLVCGNSELLAAASPTNLENLPFHMEIRFLPHEEFLLQLRRCEILLTSPGLTASLEAMAINVPCRLLLPQNYSQFRILNYYRSSGLRVDIWQDVFDSHKLNDPQISEDDAVREIGRSLEQYLSGNSDEIRRSLEGLLCSGKDACITALFRKRVSAWDGSDRVAKRIIHELERE
jgi:hypothetical protein